MLNINLEFWSNQNGITPESREMIELTRGNLLLAKADAIVNTVNTVGVMGKGIALQFSKAFPENLVAYQRACKDGSVAIGKMLVQETSSLERSLPRYIINFPTKKHWKQPSKLEYVEEGLNALVEELKRLGVRSVAVPPLGCGLGGLRWSEVLPRLIEAAQRTPDIKWLVYEPAGAPAATSMPNETVKPKMTRSIAIVIALIDRYLVPSFGYPVSLLEIHTASPNTAGVRSQTAASSMSVSNNDFSCRYCVSVILPSRRSRQNAEIISGSAMPDKPISVARSHHSSTAAVPASLT
ncbi:MAG: macro domain-containing protein [Propionivibrio sp.]|nr:macro domain-containing protein [Propionivibrio sp.]